MIKPSIVFLIFVSICSPLRLFAQEKPTVEEIYRVFKYYSQGDAPILTNSKYCVEIISSGPDKFECNEELTPTTFSFNQRPVYLWMSFLVPTGKEFLINVEFSNGSTLYETDTTVRNSYRYRVWKFVPTYQEGTWTVKIRNSDSNEVLETLSYKVEKN